MVQPPGNDFRRRATAGPPDLHVARASAWGEAKSPDGKASIVTGGSSAGGALALLKSPYLMLVLAMLCWAGNWVVGRAVHAAVPPFTLNFLRWSLALLVLAPFSVPALWENRSLLLRHWKILGALGALGMALFQSLIYLALHTTTAVNAALINSSFPVIVVLVSWAILRERISRRQGIGIAISLVGAVVIVARGSLATLIEFRFATGDLLVFSSLPVWALYTVLLRFRPQGLGPAALLTVFAFVGTIVMAPLAVWELSMGARVELSPGSVAAILYVALVASLIAFFLYNQAVSRVGAIVAGLFMHLHPVFTTVLAMIFLAERIGLSQLAGIALIVTGIYLTSTAKRVIAPANGFRQDAGS